MKKILAILFALLLSLTMAFSIVADEGDEGPGYEYNEGEDDTEETAESPEDPESEDPETPEPSSETKDSSTTKKESETTPDDAIMDPPEGDAPEFESTTISIVYAEGRDTGVWVSNKKEWAVIPAGTINENNGDHVYVDGVCKDCGDIRDGIAKVKNILGYYEGNTLQSDKTGFIYDKVNDEAAWYFYREGIVSLNYVGLEQGEVAGERAIWFVKDGKVQGYSGLCKNRNEIWYVLNGRVDMTYTGFVVVNGERWYVRGGRVATDKSGLVRVGDSLWRIENGKVDTTKSVVEQFEGTWYMARNGKVDTTYTGIGKNELGVWRIVNGKVDFSANGVVHSASESYYMVNGRADTNFNGFAKDAADEDVQWLCKEGRVDPTANGVINSVVDGVAGDYPVFAGKLISQEQYNMAIKANDYESSTDYLVMIDCTNNRLGVFKGKKGNWDLEKFWVCSTGAWETPTVTGVFEKEENSGYCFSSKDYTCYYFSGFCGPYLVHSTLFYRNTFEDLDPSLGYHASHGCVRLAIQNAKWVYYMVPIGSTFVVYYD